MVDTNHLLWFVHIVCIVSSIDLATIYASDTKLVKANNPYYVKSNVEISEQSTFIVENGVEIIFMSDYIITVKGKMIVGCNDTLLGTYDSNNRGLFVATHTHIHSVAYNHTGGISFDSSAKSGEFCNVKFEGLNRAIFYSGYDALFSFDNCEFANVAVVSNFYKYSVEEHRPIFTDCEFYDIDTVSEYGRTTFDNCKLERFTHENGILGYGSNRVKMLQVFNSEIIGDGSQTCIYMYNGYTSVPSKIFCVENNTISNCGTAIVMNNAGRGIKYNNIINSSIGVQFINSNAADRVQYNNFINNSINFELGGEIDCQYCNYNYLGIDSNNQTLISETITDICDGYSSSLIHMWPWYTATLDFDNLYNLPSATVTALECNGVDNHLNITGNRLKVVYIPGTVTTLSKLGSPYYVTNDVSVQQDAILRIDNGVEIIFVDDYEIMVKGTINVGCYDINTVISNDRGLYSNITFSYFHSIDDIVGGIVFYGSTDSNGEFCNVQFEGLDTAVSYSSYVEPKKPLLFDNCEFNNLAIASDFHYGIGPNDTNLPYFTDCKFYDITVASYGGWSKYENCLFERFTYQNGGAVRYGENIQILNCDIRGDGNQLCIHFGYADASANPAILEKSAVSNCGTAVEIYGNIVVIQFNNIFDNNVAVYLSSPKDGENVQYNNFMNNTINIQLNNNVDCLECNYNYFGINTTNQTTISAKIKDICDGTAPGSIRWWPWYLTEINFNNGSFLPSEATFVTLNCKGIDNHPGIQGKRLDVLYVSGTTTTLSTPSSPTIYYVTNDVLIQKGAILNIPVHIEIIFVTDYEIRVKGEINVGYDRDSSAISFERGLYFADGVHIHSIGYNHTGSIVFMVENYGFSVEPNGTFWNTKFEGLNTALSYDKYGVLTTRLTIDNCEFTNIHIVAGFRKYGSNININAYTPLFTDCKFYDIDIISIWGYVTFDNCLFERIYERDRFLRGPQIQIFNSDIIGNDNQTCIEFTNVGLPYTDRQGSIQNSTIKHCETAIVMNYAAGNIKFNEFSNNNIAVHFDIAKDGDVIQYNNFINNSVNVELEGDTNCDDCNFNYWGVSTSNQTLIASKIIDKCDEYSTALVTFWPWFETKYDGHQQLDDIKYNSITNRIFSFDYKDCSSIMNITSKIVTDVPTNDPTADPTIDPTSDPTMDPTSDPTTEPTIEPTINPTKVTQSPTKPTQSPIELKAENKEVALYESYEFVGYVIVGLLFLIPIILLLFGFCFHWTSIESPNYLSVVRCFMNIADFYTDSVFCISLMLTNNDNKLFYLGLVAAIFTFVPHIISITICLVTLQKWRKRKLEYVESYDNLIIGLTVLAGFYPTVDLLSSKIFHLKQTSLHLTKAQILNLKQKRFFNNILLENAPLMAIQIYSLLFIDSDTVDPITVMALIFSAISLIVGILTLISRAFGNRSDETRCDLVWYKIDIESQTIASKHQFIHSTISGALATILKIHSNRVETVQVLRTVDGVSATLNIKLVTNDGEIEINKILTHISMEETDEMETTNNNVLETLLIKRLKLENVNHLKVSISKLKGENNTYTTRDQLTDHIDENQQILEMNAITAPLQNEKSYDD